ncbi:MAG: TonB family protein [Candidatus Coatesbacteria bacterium]|nr:TonB family protein [Candidatus Coatesbacteria bacterium]
MADIKLLLREAMEALGKKDRPLAVSKLREILKIDPSNERVKSLLDKIEGELNIRTYYENAQRFLVEGDKKQAIEELQKILEIDPENLKVKRLLNKFKRELVVDRYIKGAEKALKDKEIGKAISNFEAALKYNPSNKEIAQKLALLRTELGDSAVIPENELESEYKDLVEETSDHLPTPEDIATAINDTIGSHETLRTIDEIEEERKKKEEEVKITELKKEKVQKQATLEEKEAVKSAFIEVVKEEDGAEFAEKIEKMQKEKEERLVSRTVDEAEIIEYPHKESAPAEKKAKKVAEVKPVIKEEKKIDVKARETVKPKAVPHEEPKEILKPKEEPKVAEKKPVSAETVKPKEVIQKKKGTEKAKAEPLKEKKAEEKPKIATEPQKPPKEEKPIETKPKEEGKKGLPVGIIAGAAGALIVIVLLVVFVFKPMLSKKPEETAKKEEVVKEEETKGEEKVKDVAAAKGSIMITKCKDGAEILINGESKGKFPDISKIELSPGEYKFEAKHGDMSFEDVVVVKSEETKNIEVEFVSGKGTVTISSTPSATVYVGGQLVGSTTFTKEFAAGKRVFVLKADGYEETSIAIEVKDGKSVTRNVTMKAQKKETEVAKKTEKSEPDKVEKKDVTKKVEVTKADKKETPAKKGKLVPAELISKSKASYPASASKTKFTGTTQLTLTIGVDGRVTDVKVQKSSGNSACDSEAVSAAKRYRFKPAMKGDVPIESYYSESILFKSD